MNKQELAKTHFLKGLEFSGAGDFEAAESKFREALDLAPERVSVLTNLAAVLVKKDKVAEASGFAEKAVAIDTKAHEAWMILGICRHRAADYPRALEMYDRALRNKPDHAPTWTRRGATLLALKRGNEALACHQRALQIAPRDALAWLQQGITLHEMGRQQDALASLDKSLAIDSRCPEALHARGLVLQQLWRHAEALESFDSALQLAPDNAQSWERKGATLQVLKRYPQAFEALDKAVSLRPDFSQAWIGRGNALQGLDRFDEALVSYDKALESDPQLAEAWSARASILVSDVDNVGRAMQESRRSLDAFLGSVFQAIRANPQGSTLQRFRVRHDLEQALYLKARGHQPRGIDDFIDVARELMDANVRAGYSEVIAPSAGQMLAMAPYLETPYLFEVPDIGSSCVNPDNDWAAIEDAYLAGTPEIVHIDNFLAPAALAAFREFALVSKVWLVEYVNQYLGAFANKGFVSPLHLQLARELPQVMPRVFGGHRLSHLWGFKYDSTMGKGINVHADFARVNLNFWITPDECNLDQDSGGLKVYDAPSPPDWAYFDYNENKQKIYAFLEDRQSRCVNVPHRCNRAVLFNSALFHETDSIHFKDGYESRRINFTYLFGRQL